MPKTSKTKPLLVIVLAIIAAGGLAIYLSRQSAVTEAGDRGASGGAAASLTPGSGRIRGAADAPVTLTEFGDYQCPTCGLYHPVITELLHRYQGKLKLEFHHYPLVQSHMHAMSASLAAEAAADQGKFWEMHDLIFEHQNQWATIQNAEAVFLQFALQLGLDSNQFMQSMKLPATRDRVLADVMRGNDIVGGTPTFLLNGQLVSGLPGLEGLAELIDGHLKALGK